MPQKENEKQNKANILKNLVTAMVESQNHAKFTGSFTGRNEDTLDFITKAKTFLAIQGITNETLKFRLIFEGMEECYRQEFLTEHLYPEHFTMMYLFEFLLQYYPPTDTQWELLAPLRRLRLRKNENPWKIYKIIMAKFTRLDEIIGLVNLSRDPAYPDVNRADYVNDNNKKGKEAKNSNSNEMRDERNQKQEEEKAMLLIAPVSVEKKLEILDGVFIRTNAIEKYNNCGEINKMLMKTLSKLNLNSLKAWETAMQNVRSTMIPVRLRRREKYRFICYPPPNLDRKPHTTEQNGSHKRNAKHLTQPPAKRTRLNSNNNSSGNAQQNRSTPRKRLPPCTICRRTNHETKNCFYRNKQKTTFCRRCLRKNHNDAQCRARRDITGRLLEDEFPSNTRGRNEKNRWNDKNQNYSKNKRNNNHSQNQRNYPPKNYNNNNNNNYNRNNNNDNNYNRNNSKWNNSNNNKNSNNYYTRNNNTGRNNPSNQFGSELSAMQSNRNRSNNQSTTQSQFTLDTSLDISGAPPQVQQYLAKLAEIGRDVLRQSQTSNSRPRH